ncbi:hypothetical protein EC396_08785 [Lutibacter sp. HS1-25]|uniref:hypothetical protein n=1 Tax=Lutibacter sp. HS1-25 TaxID=2485000 RepID=UPI001011B554|nr:hypothetical protein [Lutibacter sp. HS1-25]RXP54800.1 hypothetical protein EC396_08785 [Lutibacter sp. HS1-25]
MKRIILPLIAIFFVGIVYAQQEDKPSKTQFMIRGYGSAGFQSLNDEGEKESSFNSGTFAPIILFKFSDKFMFETELEFAYENGELETALEYANVMYSLNDYMTIRAGKFLLPFGTFMERLHPSWINKLSSVPLGFGHDGIVPSSGVGVELRGAFDVYGSKFNYALYSTNGPKLNDGSMEPDEAGILHFDNYEDNNKNKSLGGRLGYLPFTDSSVELGFSFLNSKVGNSDSDYENVGAKLIAYDFTFIKKINPLGGIIDIRAQYNQSIVDDANYYEPDGLGGSEEYTFNNKSDSFYAQLSYKPTTSSSNFIKNLEFVGRYSELNTPEGAEWETNQNQTAFGINYWLSWRSAIKVNYQITDGTGGHGGGLIDKKQFTIQWAFGI